MVGLIRSVVCVKVLTLLLLGTFIVEPRLIHFYDVGVVCAACVSSLCVLCLCVFSDTSVSCVVKQGVSWSVDFAILDHVSFSVHRIAVGVFVFIRVVYCACKFASVIVIVVLMLFVASVVVILCVRCVIESVVVKRVFVSVTG